MRKFRERITRISGAVVEVNATGVAYDELAVLSTSFGSSLAQVIKLEGDRVSLQVFTGTQGVSTGDRIRFLGRSMGVPFSENLLGRIFDGSGSPRDGRAPLQDEEIEVGGPPVNPVVRRAPDEMVRTGIPMIDVFNTLVVSQKLPIFAPAGEPYNKLLARIGLQADADVIILGGIGLRHDDYLMFRNTFEERGVLHRTIMFVHTAAEPAIEALLVPDMALAVGETFAMQGKKVLVLLTDMTSFADALKEVAITMEQIPSNRGYPGDLYSQLAKRYEKAVDFEERGSVTILAVTTMPGDDVTHPVPDNTGYITEGQFYLRNGRIEPFGSLSRLKQRVNGDTRDDHRAIMDGCLQLYAGSQESREKRSMGFEMSKWDVKLLKYGDMFEDRIMDLSVDIPLESALDTCWEILAACFEPAETGIRRDVLEKHWSKDASKEEVKTEVKTG
ncbi:MAG: V-type ATP synthase subunit B [Acidobacteria bacterium]|nr:V-type ATP synthase subunit B [Acidobacteriota bacterium]MCG2816408.1 V-type ATP synthase subunit B [Candidatus Aminicenantes bacterium]